MHALPGPNTHRGSAQSSDATAGDRSALGIGALTLLEKKDRQPSPPSGKKRPAESDFPGRLGKAPSHEEVVIADDSRQEPLSDAVDWSRPKSQGHRLFNPKQDPKGTSSPHKATTEPSSERSANTTKNARQVPRRAIPKIQQRQSGVIDLQKYDPRYPGLLLQPDSRPISQEQLASEVKSIYAGLTMVETKCIHVDRAQAAAAQDNSDTKLASDHWQALIALHRTLLHEHHDCK